MLTASHFAPFFSLFQQITEPGRSCLLHLWSAQVNIRQYSIFALHNYIWWGNQLNLGGEIRWKTEWQSSLPPEYPWAASKGASKGKGLLSRCKHSRADVHLACNSALLTSIKMPGNIRQLSSHTARNNMGQSTHRYSVWEYVLIWQHSFQG